MRVRMLRLVALVLPWAALVAADTPVIDTPCMSAGFACITFDNGLSVNYRQVASGADLQFFIKGAPPQNGFVAIGFNTEDKMPGASIVECIRYSSQATLHTSHATAEATPDKPIYAAGLRNGNTSSSGTELSCHFVRSKALPQGAPDKFGDLGAKTCVIMSMGEATGTASIVQHTATGEVCGVDWAATGPQAVGEGESVDPLVATHAVLMVVGWISLISPGILVARFLKPKESWGKNPKCCGKDAWFRTHQIMQSFGLICIVVGFICIFVEEGEFVDGDTEVVHAVLGIIATALGVAQPVMAFFRCAPDDANRVYFNWVHFIFGNTSLVLAMVCFMLVIDFADDAPRGVARNPWRYGGVLIGFMVFFALAYIIMEVMKRGQDSGAGSKVADSGMQMSEGGDGDEQTRKRQCNRMMIAFRVFDGLKVAFVVMLCVFMFN